MFGSTPENSYIEVQDDVLVARMGLAEYRIARADVLGAGPSSWSMLGGIGWRVAPRTLGLIGALHGIVELRLARPYTHHIALLPLRFTRLVVSLEDPAAFLAEFGAAGAAESSARAMST
ncbi:MAG TPA: hypothetical protein VJR89_04450 [Polyangiales bacterium]|nr:hypothetical protein [Polyangiales bacterium]